MDPMSQGNKKVCNCPHHTAKPWGLILIGVTLILVAIPVINMQVATIIVGVLLILMGFFKLAGRKCKCC